jgi:uncharacterized protein (TIGR02996 family)
MATEEEFLRALQQAPDDGELRLIFADWLEDQGDQRAPLVRLQAMPSRWEPDFQKRVEMQRQELLLIEQLGQGFLGPLQPYCRDWHIDRGLAHVTIEARRFTGRRFAAVARDYLHQAWVGTIRLTDLERGNFDNLEGATWLRSLASLDMRNAGLNDAELTALLANPHLENLTWLDLSGNQLTDQCVSVLAGFPWFPRLHWLDLRNNLLRPEGMSRLVQTYLPDERRRLDLHGNLGASPTVGDPARVVNSIGMEFAPIPAGSFLMGSPPEEEERHEREGPRHLVALTRPFFLGVYPVTQGQYQRIMGENPSLFSETNQGGPVHPVDSVTHTQAIEFCRRLSELPEEKKALRVYRLPTEAEWEHAARAGTSLTPFCFGSSLSAWQANFDGTRPYGSASRGPNLRRTTPVGLYRQRNAYNLFDMYGNVWEWTADRFDENYYQHSPPEDPRGPESGNRYGLRGGGWYFYGMVNRAAFRGHGAEGYTQNFIGFRVAMDG